ncbi:MAG: tetratricopeptide repeat protein, partial [Terriglobia bacterium]
MKRSAMQKPEQGGAMPGGVIPSAARNLALFLPCSTFPSGHFEPRSASRQSEIPRCARNDTGRLKQAAALPYQPRRAAPLLLGSLILCLFWVVPGRVLVAFGPGQESPSRTHHDADVSTLLRTAQDALGRNDFAAAADALKQVVEAQPTLTAAWFNLAYAYTGLHKQEEAVASYRKALALDPNLFEARLNLGILLIQLNDPQAALEHLEKAATLKPDHLRAQLY